MENHFRQFYPGTECLYKAIKILKMLDLYRLKVGTYVFKVLNEEIYPSLSASLDLLPVSHGYETRNSDTFRTPFPRVEAM